MSRWWGSPSGWKSWFPAVAIAFAVCASVASAATLQHFDLPAGDAVKTVQLLARQSGLQVLAPNADLQGVRTNAVNGDFEPVEALRRMLQGTGLHISQTDANTVTVTRAAPGPSSQTPAQPPANTQAGPTSASSTAQAQTLEAVVVTGTRIPRPGYDTLEAAIVTDDQQIRRRGYTNVIQALNDTPGFVNSGVNQVGTDQGTFNAGQNFADFFGLGSQRTLTLVNSHRFVSSNPATYSGNAASPGQQVDLNLIPIGLIDRVETVAIGGAPIYGADAIAGTVNVILKDHYQGAEITGQYGISDRDDARSRTVSAVFGTDFAQGRGNVAAAIQYNRQDGIVLGSRAGLHYELPNLLGTPSANLVTNDLVYSGMSEGGLPVNPNTFDFIRDPSGTPLQFAANQLVPYITGDPLNGLGPYLISDGGDGVRMANHFSLLTPVERKLFTGLAHYDFTPNLTAFVEADWAHTKGEELSEVAAFASPYITGTAIPVSIDNPYLTPQARAELVANGVGDSFLLARNFSDLLDRGGLDKNETDLDRVVAGLKGRFTLFGQSANWDMSLNYGRSRGVTDQKYIDNDRFLQAIDAVEDPSGNIVCRSGGDCVPFDLFGVDAFSDAAAAYVLDPARAVSINTQRDLTANLNSSLPFRISTQPIDYNIGFEYRRESGAFRPDAVLQSGNTFVGLDIASPYVPTSGAYHTREVYGEISAPIISKDQDLAIVKSFSLDAAARYVDNSIAGGATTWSVGGRFAPRLPGVLDGLLFRGVYTRSIRAPAITELFSGASSVREGLDDPCDARFYQEGDNPDVRARNCTTALAPFGVTPADFNSTTFGLSPIGTNSGNPDLKNEKAKSWSAGIVYQPPAIPDLRLAADWSDIDLRDAIQALDINTLLAACYDSPDYPNTEACSAFQRLPPSETGPGSPNPSRVPGDIANGYHSGFINTGGIRFSGLIVSAEYGLDLARWMPNRENAGRIEVQAKILHNNRYDFQAIPGGPVEKDAGSVAIPKWSGQINLGYVNDRVETQLQALYTGPAKNQLLSTSADIPDVDNLVGSYWKYNGSVTLRFNDHLRTQFVVNNIFDRKLTPAELFSHAYGTYDLIGRTYLWSVTVDL
ncbi:MAG TPA: TonB-dependent receptor [Rhodanobacteraceae bacterium]